MKTRPNETRELNCDFCELNIKEKKDEVWKNEIKEVVYSINLTENVAQSDYYFKIYFHDRDTKLNLYYLNSFRNHHFCEAKVDNHCYYLTYIEKYNNVNKLQFLVQNNENVAIYIKLIDKNYTFEKIYSELNDNNNYIYNTENNPIKNYLEYKRKEGEEEKEYYILLKVKSNSESNSKINLVSNIFDIDYPSSIQNIYREDFIIISSDFNENITFDNDKYYFLDINLINCVKQIIVNITVNNTYNNEYYLESGFRDNLNILLLPNNKYELNIKNINETYDALNYRKIMNLAESNLKEIYFRKSNYFSYKNLKNISSLNFFINLSDVYINKDDDLHLNYKLILNDTNEEYPEGMKLNLSLVNKYFILNKKTGLNHKIDFNQLNTYTDYYNNMTGNGYALFNLPQSENDLLNGELFLFIELESNFTDGLDFIISLTDFNENYSLPVNQYLYMMNKEENTTLNIIPKSVFNNDDNNNSFIEISSDAELNINFKEEVNNISQLGKTYYRLNKTINNTLIIENKNHSLNKYIFFRYGFSLHEAFSYFELNETIMYNDKDTMVSFHRIKDKNNNPLESVIYTIQIFNETNDNMEKMLGMEKPFRTQRVTNFSNETIYENIGLHLDPDGGKYYINIYAEARMEKENIYEYFVYNTLEIIHVGGIMNKNINVTMDRESFNITYNSGANIIAEINLDEEDETKLYQYKFLKLILDNKNDNMPRRRKKIYASSNESIFNSSNLYNASVYKSSGKDDKVILTVPLNYLKEIGDRKLEMIYIVIPCDEKICNLTVFYSYEDGRNIEGIHIEKDACFDLFLSEDLNNSLYTYRFVNYIEENKDNYPLITITSSSANYFMLLITGSENEYLHPNFINGYSFLFEYDASYYEYHTFLLRSNESLTFHVCHRTIKENYNQKKDNKTYKYISVGEEIYSEISNFGEGLADCFKIDSEEIEYDRYMLNYVTKTNMITINMELENGTESQLNLTGETGNIFLNENITAFCFELYPLLYHNYDSINSAINFQLIGVKNNKIFQNFTNPFLINGVSTKQYLKGGQVLYYSLKEYLNKSNYVYLHFQKIKGEIIILNGFCEDFPNCTFNESYLNQIKQNQIEYTFENYINLKEETGNIKNIYQRTNFPVYIVYCNDTKEKECHYFIELNNENNTIVLNQDKKFYSRMEEGNSENNTFEIHFKFFYNVMGDLYFPEVYLELHLLAGEISNIRIYEDDLTESNYSTTDLTKYDNKTFYYIRKRYSSSLVNYNIRIVSKENTIFYLNYFIADSRKDFIEKDEDSSYILSTKEMHYNMIKKNYFYSLREKKEPGEYIVSLFKI